MSMLIYFIIQTNAQAGVGPDLAVGNRNVVGVYCIGAEGSLVGECAVQHHIGVGRIQTSILKMIGWIMC